jgi:hypothetical protein
LNHLINFFRKRNDGYISIEVVIIGGLVIGFGAFTIEGLHQEGTIQVNNSVKTIDEKFDSPELNTIWDR